jgi:hypothetical protein
VWTDKGRELRSKDIKKRLVVVNIVEEIKERKEYAVGMPSLRYSCQPLFYKPDGKRELGRPHKMWDQII